MKRRLFISHTSKTAAASERLELLRDALIARGFDVLVDRDHLRPGDDWREEIYTWLGLCDMAVVLIAPRALEADNPWVAREATILMWRRALDPGFTVVPVLVDGVTVESLATGEFRDLLLEAVQSGVVTDDGGTAWIEPLADQLKDKAGVAAMVVEAPVELHVKSLAKVIKDLDDDLLREAAAQADVALGPWRPDATLSKRLALQILHLGLERSEKALLHLRKGGAGVTCLGTVIEIIAPGWVDLCAAHCLAGMAADPASGRPMLLNAKEPWAAEMFIRRASGSPDPAWWPYVNLAAVAGEDVEWLAAELREALIMKLKLVGAEGMLARVLARMMADRTPVFVVLRYSRGLMQHIDALKQRFSTLCFIVLGGTDSTEADYEPGLRIIVPRLGPEEEDLAFENYVYIKSQLTRD